jgi:hypothetical protein
MSSAPHLLDLVNFGMALVIWIVQVIVYPGLARYPAGRLQAWHADYTARISFFVVPLMFTQLGLLAAAAYAGGGATVHAMLAMVLLAWGATFKFSVPLHRRITTGRDPEGAARLLVRTNWPRTVLWTAVFLTGEFLG